MINIDTLCCFIKFIGINYSFAFCFYKISNSSKALNFGKQFIIITFLTLLGLIQSIIFNFIPTFFTFIPITLLCSFLFSKLFSIKIDKAISTCIISLSIAYTTSIFSMFISSIIFVIFNKYNLINYFSFICMAFLNIFLDILLFKLKRLKYGFSFLNNDLLNLFIMLIAIIIIISYVLVGNYAKVYLQYTFFITMFFSFIIIRQAFILYHKQKLQTQALKDCEKELQETKEKLAIAIEEKDKLIKANHEFYHRQEALKNKLNVLAKSSFNSETAQEFASIIDRIDTLSQEYTAKVTTLPKLTATGIVEIDDMLTYMQAECAKDKIEFIFKLECNINNIVDNLISKSELETLIGDLIRNAIIAINHSENPYRSIMLIFGLKDSFYEIDIYDSGINFQIPTLLKLGKEKCSTHLDNGGTGIGMLTTFETLENTKASLIITEYDSNTYSKMISIKFDNLNNYIINSYRGNEIQKENNNKRNIIIKTESKIN